MILAKLNLSNDRFRSESKKENKVWVRIQNWKIIDWIIFYVYLRLHFVKIWVIRVESNRKQVFSVNCYSVLSRILIWRSKFEDNTFSYRETTKRSKIFLFHSFRSCQLHFFIWIDKCWLRLWFGLAHWLWCNEKNRVFDRIDFLFYFLSQSKATSSSLSPDIAKYRVESAAWMDANQNKLKRPVSPHIQIYRY